LLLAEFAERVVKETGFPREKSHKSRTNKGLRFVAERRALRFVAEKRNPDEKVRYRRG